MQYRSLGATGVQVSAQCLRTMMFGRIGNRDHDDCAAIVSRALEAGINFVDTADVYSRRETGIPAGARYGEGGAFARVAAGANDPVSLARFTLVEKLAAVGGAAGLTLTQLALGFVQEHPAITSTIIGPRTRAQLDGALAAAEVRLDPATLDAIDSIVAPGTDVAGIDHLAGDPSLRPEYRRRSAGGS